MPRCRRWCDNHFSRGPPMLQLIQDLRRRSPSRRAFLQSIAGIAAILGLEPRLLAQLIAPEPKRLSWRAYRDPSAEGAWRLTNVEGQVPKDLNGTLYRVAPGQRKNHGVELRHLFDG